MSKYFIKQISIEGFRGINNSGAPLVINFQTNGITSIFGENGKGKSSIFEAFLFSILGKIVRFDDYHGDIKDKRTIKNLFHVGDGNIKINFIDEANNVTEINVKVDDNGLRTVSSPSLSSPDEFLSTLCSNLNFIDYRSFEKILLTSSEETGKLFSNLVGFGGFINIKEKFDKISRTQNINNDFGKTTKENSIRENNQKIALLKDEIQNKLLEIGIEKTDCDSKVLLNMIKSFLNKEYSLKITTLNLKSQIDFDQLLKTKISPQYEENVLNLNTQHEKLKEIILSNKKLNTFTSKSIKGFKKKINVAYLQISSKNDIVLGKLYDEAIKSYDTINSYDKNSCILCNTTNLSVGRNSFYEEIKSKIISFIKFKNKYNLFFDEFKQKIFSSGVIQFEDLYLSDPDRFFTNITKSSDFLANDFFDVYILSEKLSSYRAKVKNEISTVYKAINELKTLIPPKISDLVALNNCNRIILNNLKEIDRLIQENTYYSNYLLELETWTRFSIKIKEDYENAYNMLMDEIASMIDFDTKLFFKEIMGEVDIIPKLKKENKGQKVNVLLEKFYSNTNDIKAAALLSESYRNALSLSIYFAAALKSRNSGCFIVVDDITSSFDCGHQLYLLDLIKRKIALNPSNKNGKQIIFLTHDGLLKKVLNENHNPAKYWTHYPLNSNKDIVSLNPFKSDDLKLILQTKVSNGNYMGSDFRMYYEFVLLEIIEKINLEVPFSLINNNDNKMVSKLSNAIKEIIELKRASGKIRGVRFPNSNDFKVHTQQLTNNLSHWASVREISLSTPVLNRIIDDIDNFKKLFQYNCTCSAKGAGWVYFKSLSSPKHKGCTCII